MSEDNVLYRKYRPMQLDDVIGQRRVTSTLKKASENNKFVNAYLLSGNHGCGKTTTGRILATLMTCENVKDAVVCGECRPCKLIHSGSSIDVKELDGATKSSKEDIKDLIEDARWAPQEFKRKVFILDEVHQLSTAAISALLKILEEPPNYLSFILCTTEPRKILPTIFSRCQRFNFTKVLSRDIAERLVYIAKKEGIIITNEACFVISQLARGSVRDAIGYLEQIATVANGKKITESNVRSYFGALDRAAIFDIVGSVIDGNIPLIFDQVNDLMMISADVKEIMFDISDLFRNMMSLKATNNKSSILDLPDNEVEKLKDMSKNITLGKLTKLAYSFSDISKKMEFNINERWIMEAALINCVATLKNGQ